MLTCIVPKFEKGRILKTEMLENLRDYPRSFLDIRYQDYSDGIITGMNVTVGEQALTVSRGIVKHQGRLYLLEQEYEVPYMATGRLSVLKVVFQKEKPAMDFNRYVGEIQVHEEEPQAQELELGRFKLKEGALLRSEYQDFADLATEYNTVNLLCAKYAGTGTDTLRPHIFRQFAREIFQRGAVSDSLTITFAMLCLNQERIERETLIQYLTAHLGVVCQAYDNTQLHHAMTRVIEESGGRRLHKRSSGSSHHRMLVD